MERLFIGVDIGTSSAKAVLIDEAGTILKKATADYEVAHPNPEWSEIEPEVWFSAVSDCIEEILSDADRDKVEGIGVTGQMHTVVLLDENGSSIRPALLWTCKRTKGYIQFLKEQIENCPKISYLGNIISIGSPAANLYWFKENEPENFSRLHKFLIGPDYIVYRLTGVYGTDYCEASTSSLFDLRERCWSDDMQKIVGLPDRVYPEVRGSAQTAGNLLNEVAQKFGLRKDVKVITGTGDNPAAAITTGCLGHGYPVISLGTSGVFMLRRQNLNFDTRGKNILLSFDNKEFFILMQGTVQSCGSALEWWMQNILGINDLSNVDDYVDINTACRSNVIFYPHLQGDKTLFADPNLSGAFIGLRTETTRWEMVYAVLEGICFAFKELADKMSFAWDKHQSIRVVGGGSKSRIWMQMMADILNIDIEQMDGPVSASLGIALLCSYGSASTDDFTNVSEGVMKVRGRFSPRPEFREIYENKLKKYLKIHNAVIEITSDI